MIYRLALFAIVATGLVAGDADAQLSLRNLTRKKSSKKTVTSRPLTDAQMQMHVNKASKIRASAPKRPAKAEPSQVRKVSHVKKASCDLGLGGCGGGTGCGCSSGCGMSVASPRCFSFDSGCGGGAIGCDLCCGTIFSELYCSMQNMFSRATAGGGLFGGLVGRPCSGGIFGSSCGSGCSSLGGCSETFEPACGIADACGDDGCSGGCAMAEPGCGIADAGVVECAEPACGIADACGDVCSAPAEPACGIAGGGCSGGACFQDLLSSPCGGCGGGLRSGGGFLSSLGSMLFGECGSSCGCSGCSSVAASCEPACGIADACGMGACGAEPACGIADVCAEPACGISDGGCSVDGCSGGCAGGCAVRRPYGDSQIASRGRTLKYTISQKPGSREPVYVGQRPAASRVDAPASKTRTAKKQTIKRTSHNKRVRTPSNRTRPSAQLKRESRKIGLVNHEQVVDTNDKRTTIRFADELARDLE